MRPQPLISVTDVPRSSRWYQELLGCESGHGGDEYERLLREGTLVLQLHRFDVEHHHGRIGDPSSAPKRRRGRPFLAAAPLHALASNPRRLPAPGGPGRR
jgi:catechol 2,3-dioxygenase-like lactoylglutathione lyase family enzyme